MSDNDHHYRLEEELSDIRDQLETAQSDIKHLRYELETALKEVSGLKAETADLRSAVLMLRFTIPFCKLARVLDKIYPNTGINPPGDAVRNILRIPDELSMLQRISCFLGRFIGY